MRKLAQRAVIAGASVLTIVSAVGGADLLGQAHADPLCVANGADPCQPQADPPQADPPNRSHFGFIASQAERSGGLSAVSSGCHESGVMRLDQLAMHLGRQT
jgi:hypothetical protein